MKFITREDRGAGILTLSSATANLLRGELLLLDFVGLVTRAVSCLFVHVLLHTLLLGLTNTQQTL